MHACTTIHTAARLFSNEVIVFMGCYVVESMESMLCAWASVLRRALPIELLSWGSDGCQRMRYGEKIRTFYVTGVELTTVGRSDHVV